MTARPDAHAALDAALDLLTADLGATLTRHRAAIDAALPTPPRPADFPAVALMAFDAALTDVLVAGGMPPVAAANNARVALAAALQAIPIAFLPPDTRKLSS